MSELLYKEEVFKLVGFCMEIHRELGKGHNEIIYKDALAVELHRAQIPFARELKYEITYKGVILPHHYHSDFVISDKILFEGKANERAKEQTCPKRLRPDQELVDSCKNTDQYECHCVNESDIHLVERAPQAWAGVVDRRQEKPVEEEVEERPGDEDREGCN